jgi:hypothetical protein
MFGEREVNQDEMMAPSSRATVVGGVALVAVAVVWWYRRGKSDGPDSALKQQDGDLVGGQEVDLHGRPWRKHSTRAARAAYFMKDGGSERAEAANAAAEAAEVPIVCPTKPDGTDLEITPETLHRWLSVSLARVPSLTKVKTSKGR